MLYKDGAPAVGALLFDKASADGQKLIYSPRSPSAISATQRQCANSRLSWKKYAKKIGAIAVKADLFVIRENYENQNAADFGNSFDKTIRVMQECGFVHRGLSTDINAYFQPRFNMAIPLFNENGPIDSGGIFENAVPKKTRYYMGSFHNSKGIEFTKSQPG